MPDFQFKNFKFGLDTRKSELTSVPGTLLTALNGHINQGGEFEKRKALVKQGSAPPNNSFGLEVTSSGLTVFGSVATGTLAPALPGYLTYVRCQHPDGATAMTAILSSRCFGGFAVCVAKFADGNTYSFYNGVLISDFIAGLILASQNTNTKIGTAFAAAVNTLSPLYTATDNVNGTVDAFSSPGAIYQATDFKTSALGVLGLLNNGPGVGTIAGQSAVGQFQIVAGASGTITNVKVNGVEILGSTVNWTLSNSATATLVAKTINLYNISNTTGYVASANSAGFVVISTVALASTANSFVVKVVTTKDVCIGSCLITFSFTTAPVAGSAVIVTAGLTFQAVLPSAGSANLFAGATTVNWNATVGGVVVNSPNNLATVVANLIQANTANSLAVACAVGATVYIAAATTTSTDAPVQLNFTTTNNVITTPGTTIGLQALVGPTNGVASGTHPTVFTCSVMGGTAPFSFQWARTIANPYFTANTPTSPTTSFTFVNNPRNPNTSSSWQCIVTDAAGVTVDSNIITVNAPA